MTAVEFLYFQFYNSKYFYQILKDIESKGTIKNKKNILEQAKEMEKQQIIDAINYCRDKYIDSENYYNKNYKK